MAETEESRGCRMFDEPRRLKRRFRGGLAVVSDTSGGRGGGGLAEVLQEY